MKKVYIAGPYTAATNGEKQENIAQAMDAAAELFRRGFAPFCPHSMTADFDMLYEDIPKEVYLETDLLWLDCCDAVLMLPGWAKSQGALAERERARELGITICYSIRGLEEAFGLTVCRECKGGGDTDD